MANILVMQMEDYHSEEIQTDLSREGHLASILSNDMHPERVVDEVAKRLRDTKFDIFFIDGMIAYNSGLRGSLEREGIAQLPLLVAFLQYDLDRDLRVSGCDFGKSDYHWEELYPSYLAKALSQTPIPRLSGLNFNPRFWREENSVYVRR